MHQGELMMKKLALIPFMLSMAFAGQSQAALTDGVYETTVNGHNAPMTVKVTIKDHKIACTRKSAGTTLSNICLVISLANRLFLPSYTQMCITLS